MIHILIVAIVSAAMYATIKAGGPVQDQKVNIKSQLIDDVAFLSNLLKSEFIFDVGGLTANLDNTLSELHASNVISYVNDNGTVITSDSIEDKWVILSVEERRIGRENFGIVAVYD